MTWKQGQSGNPEGSKAEKVFLGSVKRAIAQDNGKRLREAAEQLLDKAASGEEWAIQMLADRLDGKAVQQVDVKHEHDFGSFIATIGDALGQGASDLPAMENQPGELRH